MIETLLSIAVAFVAGCAAVFGSGVRRPLLRAMGEAWLLGIALCAGSLFALALAGIAWSLARALIVVAVVTAVLMIVGLRRRATEENAASDAGDRRSWVSAIFDLLTAATIAGYALLATAGPLAEIDFVAMWGLKARAFWIARGLDWSFLESPWYNWIHADYPPLLPLTFDWTTLFQGQWDDRWLGALYPCFALAVLLIIRSLLEEELGSPVYAAAVTLALAPAAASPWIGIAEGPLLAYGTAGVLLLRRALRDQIADRRSQIAGSTGALSIEYASLFLGCAAATKNEGMALLLAAALAMLVSTRNRAAVWRLWPAVAIAAPWLLVRAVFSFSTDLARGQPWLRVIENARHLSVLMHGIAAQTSGHYLFWIGVIAALVLSFRRAVHEERLVLVTVGLLLLFDVIASLSTAQGVAWLVRWSWERLLAQVALMAGFTAAVLIDGVRASRPQPPDVSSGGLAPR